MIREFIKKFGIVIICVVVVLAILGTNGRFTYNGLTTAASMFSNDFNEILDNFSKTSSYFFVIKNWSPEATITVDKTMLADLDDFGKPIIGSERRPGIVVNISVWDDDSESFIYEEHREFFFGSEAERDKIYFTLQTFRQNSNGNWWDGIFNSLGFGGATIVNFFYSAATAIWDTADALLSLIDAFFFLLGF